MAIKGFIKRGPVEIDELDESIAKWLNELENEDFILRSKEYYECD